MEAEQKISANEQKAYSQNPGFKIPDNGLFRSLIDRFIKKNGIKPKWVPTVRKQIIRDWNRTVGSTKEKLWALRSGFLPSRIAIYGLTKENQSDFMSDFDIYRVHPANNHFEFWINDKITLKYILANPLCIDEKTQEYLDFMPEYYLYIENDGRYSYLMNTPTTIKRGPNFLLDLLKWKKELALKPSNGSGGRGFVHLKYKDGKIIANSEPIEESKFNDFASQLNGYIITEYVYQHKELAEVWSGSECTLRIIVGKHWPDTYTGGELNVFAAYARFGTEMSGGACNMNTGGVAIDYNFETGEYGDNFFRYPGFGENGRTKYETHPDTGVSLKGKKLPHYDLVKKATYAMCNYLSSLEYFGLDFVVTEDSVKLLEVNSLPPLFTPQALEGAAYKNEKTKQFFQHKLQQKRK